jgi:HSP20 family molecular chaperone IbpA
MFIDMHEFNDAFRLLDMVCNFDPAKSRLPNIGLRDIIPNPHNLYTTLDKDGKPTSWEIEIVYTPFSKKDVSVKVTDNCLAVEIGKENKEKPKGLVYQGISHQCVKFNLVLSDIVDIDNIKAIAEDGILKIVLPVKTEVKKIERQIDVL